MTDILNTGPTTGGIEMSRFMLIEVGESEATKDLCWELIKSVGIEPFEYIEEYGNHWRINIHDPRFDTNTLHQLLERFNAVFVWVIGQYDEAYGTNLFFLRQTKTRAGEQAFWELDGKVPDRILGEETYLAAAE